MKNKTLKLLTSLFIVTLFGIQMNSAIAQDNQIKSEFEII